MQQVPADRVIGKLVAEIADLHRELAIVRVQLEMSQEVVQPVTAPAVPQSALPSLPEVSADTAA